MKLELTDEEIRAAARKAIDIYPVDALTLASRSIADVATRKALWWAVYWLNAAWGRGSEDGLPMGRAMGLRNHLIGLGIEPWEGTDTSD